MSPTLRLNAITDTLRFYHFTTGADFWPVFLVQPTAALGRARGL
jgi:hypothetical protein